MKKSIALLGIGTVGSGVYDVIHSHGDIMLHRNNTQFNIKKILVKDKNKKRNSNIDSTLLTESFEEILNDSDITIVGEFLGGVHPALKYVEKLLKAGKSVVTANKELIANHWSRLEAAARASGAGLYYEAAVAGGIPIISTFNNSLQVNNVQKIMGIINGTTNYILTKMSTEGIPYNVTLQKAQSKGLAEPDPTNDVEGYDAKYKLSILLSLAFHARVPVENIFT
ncbi:MAG: homoserine dehydrogenase, partial [Clostridiales bacterium]|nr:homoserine dehydrogenase [Clostridiales bacterium]